MVIQFNQVLSRQIYNGLVNGRMVYSGFDSSFYLLLVRRTVEREEEEYSSTFLFELSTWQRVAFLPTV